MKRMKKIFAMLLAFTMVLGMTMTASAETLSTTITINNIKTDAEKTEDNTVISIVQIVAPDPSTETGWKFVNGAESAFKEALKVSDAQDAIWRLILKETSKDSMSDSDKAEVGDLEAVSAGELATALSKVAGYKSTGFSAGTDKVEKIEYDNNTAEITVTSAGVYAIKGQETGYVYNDMAAYIGFDTYTDGVPTALKAATLNAKKIDVQIEKEASEEDQVVAIGKEVTYTVTTTVPYISEKVTDDTLVYNITDTLTGATYVRNTNEKVDVLVSVNGVAEAAAREVAITTGEGTEQFVIDLKDIAKDRTKANNSLVLTYKVIITEQHTHNSVVPSDGEHEFEPATTDLYTGSITMTKTDEANIKLAGAGFVVYNTNDVQFKDKYATFNENNVLTGWVDSVDGATEVFTDNNGTVTIYGLDDSVTYYFEEKTAPTGYSINETDSVATWDATSEVTAKVGSATMVDTKLIALPSTGGIGTTIFTVAGCGIMIAAAFFFFAGRKKEEN